MRGREKSTSMSREKDLEFTRGDFVVYPTHGVGKVLKVETQEIAGHKLKLFVISFDRDRMTLRVPVSKAATSGLRKLSTRKMMDNAMATLKGRARVKRTARDCEDLTPLFACQARRDQRARAPCRLNDNDAHRDA